MHGAPSVSYPVGRSPFAGLLLLAAWLLGAAAAAAMAMQTGALGWRAWLMGGVVLAAGVFAAASWWRTASATLAWDGESWSWSSGTVALAGEVEVALDLQQRLLLRFSGGGSTRWLWLERRLCIERWDDLRRAVYSRARPQALPGAQQPAAKP